MCLNSQKTKFPSVCSELSIHNFNDLSKIKEQIKFALSLKTWISPTEYNNKKCYKIIYSDEIKIYIDKDNCTLVEIHEEPTSKYGENLSDIYDQKFVIKFNTVKDTDITVPEK